MQSIQQKEAEVYTELWSSVPSYRRVSPGERYADLFHAIVNDPGATVLDAGCGEGKGMDALAAHGYQMCGIDLTDAGWATHTHPYPFVTGTIWHDLRPVVYLFHVSKPEVFRPDGVDYVYSCDVFEHLPEQFTMLAAQRLLEVTKKGVFLSIMHQQEIYGSWVGRRLHLTVKPFVWWRDAFREIAEVVEARDMMERGVFYLRAK